MARTEKQNPMAQALDDLAGVFRRGSGHAGQQAWGQDRALMQILRYFKKEEEAAQPPAEMESQEERIDFILRPTGILRRRVRLEGAWWKDAMGPLLGRRNGEQVALLPGWGGGYYFWDEGGRRVKVGRKNAPELAAEADCFYRSFPARPMKARDMLRFLWQSVSWGDVLWVAAAALCVSLMGMVLPYANKLLFDSVIPGGLMEDIWPVTGLMVGAILGSLLFDVTRSLLLARFGDKLTAATQNAAMARMFSLPVSFFRDYQAGELAQRVNSLTSMADIICNTVMTTGLSAVFSLVYLFQMNAFAPSLVGPGLLVIGVTVALIGGTTLLQMRYSKKRLTVGAKLSGLVYSMLGGIQKIKLSGSEARAFAKWANLFAKEEKLTYRPPLLLRISGALSGAVTLGGTILIYFTAGTNGVSQSDYMAFAAAYGAVSAALLGLSGVVIQLAAIRPLAELAKPVLDAQPEVSQGKRQAATLTGEIEISHVSFRYGEKQPLVLEDFSLHVRPGEYVGIVGRSGCGKSTLMRLLLGFERPEAGAIYYDGVDLADFDLQSLRRRIGVALQDGKLFAGDIFSNIVVTAPWSTMDDAWEAARLAGIAGDIEEMPMGMMTIISEGSGGISGGQRQRILIARALVGRPQVLLFDEATSALDNVTQETVAQNLASLGCTRIAIAHRLSTVKQCDRIVVIDGGKIAEEGSFEALMEKRGLFYELASRQL